MDNKRSLWNTQQSKLREILLKPDRFDEAIGICLEQHSMVHSSEMSRAKLETFEDELWEGVDEATFKTAVGVKGRTIAYGIWHSSRIEDITMNILVAEDNQVIDSDNWLTRINASIYDTGNSLSPDEILQFSSNVDMQELRKYRIAVGRRTREIIQGLKQNDLKRKFNDESLRKIFDIGAVLKIEASSWLVDFWGRKNVAGILLMPVTRHHLVHLNESQNAKNKSASKRK